MRLPTAVLLSSLVAAALAPVLAQTAAPAKPRTMQARTMQDVLDASQPSDWRELDPARTLYMELDSGRVVIELAPQFAPAHVANITAMAREGYWDGLAIVRSQDNFVVQWGDPYGDDPAKARPLGSARTSLPAEFSTPIRDELPFVRLPDVDGWAPEVGFSDGFPVGRDPAAGIQWLAHCYGIVGAGRGNAPDSSNGTGLYVVIGQSPRQLDLNITTVGRVLEGMPLLAALPRGQGPGGFYEEPALRTPIRRIALAAALPEAERPRLERLDTASPSFAALVEARRNRAEAWYQRQAGHIDLCNVPLPVRERPGR